MTRHLRIYNEIGAIRKVSEATIISLEKNRAEYGVIENTLRYLRQEGSAQERQYEELIKTTKSRKEQMVANKSQLNYIINRSENSIAFAKQTDFEARLLYTKQAINYICLTTLETTNYLVVHLAHRCQ